MNVKLENPRSSSVRFIMQREDRKEPTDKLPLALKVFAPDKVNGVNWISSEGRGSGISWISSTC
ncbi:hypothetical protein P40081_13940 [Paenibacillus sp. FSL P4-0081]|jgi:hypothetical protein|nr:hypothetical protein P40081_13940 [Paenibacillus sp. FSL P4-0081]